MGLMDKMLQKQELKGSTRYVEWLEELRPALAPELSEILCNETDFTHIGFQVQLKTGEKMRFHRCRNIWMAAGSNMFVQSYPIGPVQITNNPLAALEPVLAAINHMETKA
jgi:hypothetical protein